MQRLKKHSMSAIAAAGVLLFISSDKCAHAYIDPGTGSYVIQVLAASLLAVAFIIKSTWRNIRDAVVKFCKRRTDA